MVDGDGGREGSAAGGGDAAFDEVHGFGSCSGVEVELEYVGAADAVGTVGGCGEVSLDAVGGDGEGDVVGFGVDGQAEVGGDGEVGAVEVDEEEVVAAERLPAVGGEVEGVAVGMDEGAAFVAGGVDCGAEVDGGAPGAVGVATGAPDARRLPYTATNSGRSLR